MKQRFETSSFYFSFIPNRMKMKMKIFTTALFLAISTMLMAQDDVADPNFTEYQDKVPGTLLFEFGYNFLQDGTPENMNTDFLGSRTANIYYMYDFRVFGSKYISINPGFGIGMDNYMFAKDVTLTRGAGDQLVVISSAEFESGINTDSIPSSFSIRKSKLNANYFDIPIEIRFRSKPSKNSFRFAIGGKFGFLIDAKTKVKYRLDGDTYKSKSKSQLGLENFRYGLHGRVGFGSFNFFLYYALSELFEKNVSSTTKELQGNISNVTVGITLVTF